MQPYRLAARSRRSFNRVFFAASSVCEALEPRQLLSAVTMFPTDVAAERAGGCRSGLLGP